MTIPTLTYFYDEETFILDLDGYNSGGRTIEIKDGAEARILFDHVKGLQHDKDSSTGLWCVDRDPKDTNIDWIREHTFRLNMPSKE